MTNSLSAPSTKLDAFVCPHCSVYAHQSWYWILVDDLRGAPDAPVKMSGGSGMVRSASQSPGDLSAVLAALEDAKTKVAFVSRDKRTSVEGVQNVYFSRCAHCNHPSIWVQGSLSWPKSSAAPPHSPDMPAALVKDYLEAASISSQSPRGSAALLRLLIQKLCIELLNLDLGNLNSSIQRLVDQGLAIEVQSALDIVRVIGNEAVHPGQIDFSDDTETVEQLFVLVNLIIEQTITRRKQIDAMMAKLPAGAKEAIEKRGAKKS